jgi:hypothetical protein
MPKPIGKGAGLIAVPDGAIKLTDVELAELRALDERFAAKKQVAGDLLMQYKMQEAQLVNDMIQLKQNRDARIGEILKEHDVTTPNATLDLKAGIIIPS